MGELQIYLGHVWSRFFFLGGRDQCSFVPSVQDFMPFECPVNVRRGANNGSAEFPRMKVPFCGDKDVSVIY